MKKMIKFYAMLCSIIAMVLMYSWAVCPLLNMSNSIANIFGWLLIPIPIILLRLAFIKLYPLTNEKIKEELF